MEHAMTDAIGITSKKVPPGVGDFGKSGWWAERRRNLCKSLVRSGAVIVRDGNDHSEKVNRCTVAGGECVGYYEVLIDYDEAADTFCIGYRKHIPASQVNEVMLFDAVYDLAKLIVNETLPLIKTPQSVLPILQAQ